MEYSQDGEPQGFDPRHDISLSDAVELVVQMHPTARALTVRKFIVGIALQSAASGIVGYAEAFEESYVRLDREGAMTVRGKPERYASIPDDFWQIGMAISADAAADFATNTILRVVDLTMGELPYRLRDRGSDELQSERVCLTQHARNIHFPRRSLEALAQDRQWQAWGDVASTLLNRGKRGRPPAWQWDEVKAALTIEAARDPEILRSGPGRIVQFINDEMRHLNNEQIPDRKEVDRYVQYFRWLWEDGEGSAP